MDKLINFTSNQWWESWLIFEFSRERDRKLKIVSTNSSTRCNHTRITNLWTIPRRILTKNEKKKKTRILNLTLAITFPFRLRYSQYLYPKVSHPATAVTTSPKRQFLFFYNTYYVSLLYGPPKTYRPRTGRATIHYIHARLPENFHLPQVFVSSNRT